MAIIIELSMRIELFAEHQIHTNLANKISSLLQLCFPDYPANQIYLNQKPSFRALYFSETNELLGHIAVENRTMNNAGDPIQVYGLADICVHPDFQQKKNCYQNDQLSFGLRHRK